MRKKTKKNYMDADEFREEIIECRKTNEISEQLGEFFQLLCQRNSGAFMYVDETDRQDCIQTAVLQCVKAFTKYDINTSTNAFSYFTMVAINGLRAGWNKMHRNKSREYRLSDIFSGEQL